MREQSSDWEPKHSIKINIKNVFTFPSSLILLKSGRCVSSKSLKDLIPLCRTIANKYKVSLVIPSHFKSGTSMKPSFSHLLSWTTLSCSLLPSKMLYTHYNRRKRYWVNYNFVMAQRRKPSPVLECREYRKTRMQYV